LLSISQLGKSNLFVKFYRNGGASLRIQGKKSPWIEAMEIDDLYILRTMLENNDCYQEKLAHRVMAVTIHKKAIWESALWHFHTPYLSVDAIQK